MRSYISFGELEELGETIVREYLRKTKRYNALYIAEKHKGKYSVLQVGTGDSPLTVPFYEKCGFVKTHSIKNFFIDNYDHPIYECGVRLTDMIYLQRAI